jgi:cobalt-zinc-cadmium efflux system outer membrane protein
MRHRINAVAFRRYHAAILQLLNSRVTHCDYCPAIVSRVMRFSRAGALTVMLAALSVEVDARADGRTEAPAPLTIPGHLGLEDALRTFRSRGVDLLLADQAARAATGAVSAAGQVRNPTATALAGPTFNQNIDPPCSGCSRVSLVYGVSDSGALIDALSGKRGARVRQSLELLAGAKAHRADIERVLVGQLKTAYVEVALAEGASVFAREVQATLEQTLDLTRKRYPAVISEAELARVETQKLEGDQQVALAEQALRNARITLAALLGATSRVPDFSVDARWLGFSVPKALETIDESGMLRGALSRRPDVSVAAHAAMAAVRAQEVAERGRFPDVTLSMQVAGIGSGQQAASPSALTFGVATNLPVFYQRQGEIRRARGQVDALALSHAKSEALVAADVAGAVATFRTTRALVERMQKELLPRAATARQILALQFASGKAPLMDYLDAQRTYIAVRQEYFDDLAAYWSAVFLVEQAIAIEVTP